MFAPHPESPGVEMTSAAGGKNQSTCPCQPAVRSEAETREHKEGKLVWGCYLPFLPSHSRTCVGSVVHLLGQGVHGRCGPSPLYLEHWHDAWPWMLWGWRGAPGRADCCLWQEEAMTVGSSLMLHHARGQRRVSSGLPVAHTRVVLSPLYSAGVPARLLVIKCCAGNGACF